MSDRTIRNGKTDDAIADWLADRLETAFERGGPVAITVPGGSTPFPIIETLIARDLPWERLVVWPNDDRVVPEDHAASNTGKLRALFERVGAEVATLTVTLMLTKGRPMASMMAAPRRSKTASASKDRDSNSIPSRWAMR